MENNLEQEVKDLVAKMMPAEGGKIILDRLNRLELVEKELVKTKEELERTKRLYSEATSKLYDVDRYKHELESRETTVTNRETAVHEKELALLKKELQLENEVLKVKVAEAEKRGDVAEKFVAMVFKSPTFRKYTTTNDITKNVWDHNKNLGVDVKTGESKIENTEED